MSGVWGVCGAFLCVWWGGGGTTSLTVSPAQHKKVCIVHAQPMCPILRSHMVSLLTRQVTGTYTLLVYVPVNNRLGRHRSPANSSFQFMQAGVHLSMLY